MRNVPQSFHDMAKGNVRPHSWGVRISFDKSFDDDVTFFTLNQSRLNSGDILAPTDDNIIQAWDYYDYKNYTDRVTHMSWDRTLEFPYSVSTARADFELANTDNYFTPDTTPPQILETNYSKNPSFELGTGTQVEVRRNYVTNPRMIGSGTTATSWSDYSSGTVTGTRSVSGDIQTITQSTGAGRIGVRHLLATLVPSLNDGKAVTLSIDVKTLNLGTGTAVMYAEAAGGGTFPYTSKTITSTGRQYLRYQTAQTGRTSFSLYVWVEGGTGTMSFTDVMAEEIDAELPYFDGSTNGGFDTSSLTPSWTGTANNSASVLMGEGVLGASPSGFASPAWLSSDNPNHGSKFARTLLKGAAGSLRAVDATGVVSGDITTVMGAFRLNRAVNVNPTIWKSGVNDKILGYRVIPANEWTEIRDTYTPTAASSEFGLYSNLWQAGDILDYDNHFVIKGNYTGEYFDGSSGLDYSWQGQPNNSISYQYEPRPGIGRYILPKRPIRLLSGFRNILLPQFVGLTQGMPDISEQSKTASFTALDFLTQIFDLPIRETIAMRDVRTDEVLENIFLQFGLTPQQFDLRKARNVIPFLFFERNQQTAGEVIRKLMEAEMGRLWLDEDGIIRFIPRLEVTNEPVYELNDRDIVSINVSSDTQLINTVRIINRTRVVQQYQDVYKVSDDTRPEGVIPASSSRVYSAQLQDPCLTIEPPTRGAQSGVSWFVAKTAGGDEVTSGITVTATELKTNSYEITFANTNNFSVQITDIQLFGQPAKIINPNDPEQIFEYPPSIEKYEVQPSAGAADDGGLVIENNFIQTFSQAQALAVTILDDYAEYAAIIDCEIKGNHALQLGDIVELNYRQYTGNYRIIGMSQSLQPGRFVQNLKLRKYEQREYFALNVSQLNGSGVLAP